MVSKFFIAGALALMGAGAGYRSLSSKAVPATANATVRVYVEQVLKVELEQQVGCEVGDMNAIADHLSKLSRPKLLLTVEALKPNATFKPIVHPVTVKALKKGVTKAIKLKGSNDDHDLGIFLCSDTAGTNSCLGKAPLDMERASFMTTDRSQETLLANKKLNKSETPDAVFLFQYGRLSDKELRVIKGPSGDGRQEAATHLADSSVEKVVAEMLAKTTSMPIELAPLKGLTVMRMPLKFFDKQYCEKETLRKHRELVDQEMRLRKKKSRTAKTH